MKRIGTSFIVAILLSVPSYAETTPANEAPTWNCKDATWNRDPEMQDGIFKSDLKMECGIEKPKTRGFFEMANALKQYLSKTRTIHKVDEREGQKGVREWTLDTTVKLSEDKEAVAIHEMIFIKSDGKTDFVYETASKEIFASGMASYLKSVNFIAKITPQTEGKYKIVMQSVVHVQRPWFALAPLFFSIAKGVAVDKFSVARDRILPKLVDAL